MPTLRALRVWRRNLESWKRYAPSFFVAALGEPIFYLLAIGYGLGRFVAPIDGLPYAAFLAPGMIAFTAMNSATFETTFGSFTRMTEQNTYAAILATPRSFAWLLPLTHAVNVCRALASGTLTPGLAAELAWMAIVTGAAFVVAERWVRRRVLP